MLTREEVKEIIFRDFKGKAEHLGTGVCSYKIDDGRKCVVGLFIPEGHESQTFIGSSSALIEKWAGLAGYMPLEDEYLAELQECHDNLPNDMSVEVQKQVLFDKYLELKG